ncbi:MAG: hypothetical protein A3J28_09680 [Acidobacteria bacterium RIFCSPLOWO2_12_FULL_60_22]|nr:MAG: hypothetical protein A3J28_09680 [Acidobacteria bacterium RIFCSPLOWO2_12_FULL_60_22]
MIGETEGRSDSAMQPTAAHLQLRIGIHSGPVYRRADINGNRNVVGGGVNGAYSCNHREAQKNLIPG